MTPDGLLFEQPLAELRMKRAGEPAGRAEYVVGVDWRKTLEPYQANIVCKLRDQATVDFLIAAFGAGAT